MDETALSESVFRQGYAFGAAADFDNTPRASSWAPFRRSWHDLDLDCYTGGSEPYRTRSLSGFALERSLSTLLPLPPAAFQQSRAINQLLGGLDRHFSPPSDVVRQSPWLPYLIFRDFNVFDNLVDRRPPSGIWHIRAHQVRVWAEHDHPVLPAPEGLHRDGHEFIAIHLVGRANVSGGTSLLFNTHEKEVARRKLMRKLDTIFIDDRTMLHDVEPIVARLAGVPAWRDTLIIDFDHG